MASGWGWDAVYQRFIGNLHWTGEAGTNELGGEVVPPFAGEFRFTRDAMAGGEAAGVGKISRYTLEHPAGTRATQNWLNQNPNIDLNSPTGYVRWDQASQSYVTAETGYAAPVQRAYR